MALLIMICQTRPLIIRGKMAILPAIVGEVFHPINCRGSDIVIGQERIFTTNDPLWRKCASALLLRSMHTSTKGGSSEAEQNELTVRPIRPP